MSAQHYAALQALYGVTSNDLLRSLPDMAEGLHTQLHELQRAPSASAAEQLAINLEGARRALQRIADTLRREGVD